MSRFATRGCSGGPAIATPARCGGRRHPRAAAVISAIDPSPDHHGRDVFRRPRSAALERGRDRRAAGAIESAREARFSRHPRLTAVRRSGRREPARDRGARVGGTGHTARRLPIRLVTRCARSRARVRPVLEASSAHPQRQPEVPATSQSVSALPSLGPSAASEVQVASPAVGSDVPLVADAGRLTAAVDEAAPLPAPADAAQPRDDGAHQP